MSLPRSAEQVEAEPGRNQHAGLLPRSLLPSRSIHRKRLIISGCKSQDRSRFDQTRVGRAVHWPNFAVRPFCVESEPFGTRIKRRRMISMQTRRANFGVIVVLGVAALSTGLAGQTNGGNEVGQDATKHPAFQVMAVGEGRAIIMIPGLASSGTTWDATVKHLRGQYRCLELTLAGFVGVPAIQGPLLMEARDQIAHYIRDNHLERPVIIGHSLGGSIALDLASRYPDLVGPVIIVDSLPFFAGAWFQADTLAKAKPTIEQMRKGMSGMTHEQWVAMTRSGASTNSMATSATDQKTLIDWGLASDQKAVTDAMVELVSVDLRPELSRIETPVLVLGTWVGLQGYGVTKDSATAVFREQYSGVKNLDFAMAEKSRHFVMWDDPAWFNTQVDGFLAAHAGVTER
jgi:N-formylmaleamate deformylase